MKIKNYFFQIINRIIFLALAISSAFGFIPAYIYLQNFDRPSWTLFFSAIFFSLLTYFWTKLMGDEGVDFNSWETPFWKLIPSAVFFMLLWISVMTWFYLLGGGSVPDSNYPLG